MQKTITIKVEPVVLSGDDWYQAGYTIKDKETVICLEMGLDEAIGHLRDYLEEIGKDVEDPEYVLAWMLDRQEIRTRRICQTCHTAVYWDTETRSVYEYQRRTEDQSEIYRCPGCGGDFKKFWEDYQ